MTKKRCELITLKARQETRHVVAFLSVVQTEAKQKCFLVNNFFHIVKPETKLFTPALKFQKEKLPKYLIYLFLTSS